jgi:ferritin-like metal-binding protein YciE
MNELTTLYVKKLEKMLGVEDQIISALPGMIAQATSSDLREGLTEHLDETRMQRNRLADILSNFNYTATSTPDKAFAEMVSESEEEVAAISDPMLRDAAIVAAAQGVEHFEIAKYGTLIDWAKQVGDAPGEGLLRTTLGEEEAADKKLSALAEGGIFQTGINEMAARNDDLEA